MMDRLIPILNKIQDVVTVVDSNPLDLPQIVVLGSQSSGKSSVLESLVGKDFLPRGSGIVTRRPLVLQLIKKSSVGGGGRYGDGGVSGGSGRYGDGGGGGVSGYGGVSTGSGPPKEWGEFLHVPNKKYTDFGEIRNEIEKDTDKVAGRNKGISYQPINLKIYSPNVVDLTLIDLPGLTKVAVGEQPKDIAEQIQKMVIQFIEKPSTIILAVTPANSDLANSDALKLAQLVDPQGNRTIGVLTKLDLMDKGTDCMEILHNRVYSLRLGFIPIVLRSQQDIVQNKPISEAQEAENTFFRTHPNYRQISQRCGVPYLAKTLNKILMAHIRECLPDLRLRVNSMLTQTRQDLDALGDETIVKNKGAQLLNIINSFVHTYCNTIDGRLATTSSTEELYGGARINYIFNEVFGSYVDQVDSKGGLTDDEIHITITNATGPKDALFIAEESFEQLVRVQVRVLEEPALKCIELVFDELHRIINCIELNELKRFGNLREKMIEVVYKLLKDCKIPCRDMVKSLLAIEMAFVNTNHPDFIGGEKAKAKVNQKREQQQLQNNVLDPQVQQQQKKQESTKSKGLFSGFGTKKEEDKQTGKNLMLQKVPPKVIPRAGKERTDIEEARIELICTLMESYFEIVRKNIKDRVPKSIMFFLVNSSKEKMQNELVKELYKEEKFEILLEESEDVARKREDYKKKIKVLASTQKILDEVVDFKV